MKRWLFVVLSLVGLNVLAVGLILIGTQLLGGPPVSQFVDDVSGMVRRGELSQWLARDVLSVGNCAALAVWLVFQYIAVRTLARMGRERQGFAVDPPTPAHG